MGLGRDFTNVPSYSPVLLFNHLVSQDELSELQMVSFQDGGAMQLGQRVARSVGIPECLHVLTHLRQIVSLFKSILYHMAFKTGKHVFFQEAKEFNELQKT